MSEKIVDKAKLAEIQSDMPKVANAEYQAQMFPFDGQWLPSIDPTLIGPKNYQELVNMRYSEGGLEGVNGHYDFNSTAITDNIYIKTGKHFRTNRTDDSYIIVHAKDASDDGKVFYSTSDVGCDEGDGSFDSTALHTDASNDLNGRFSQAPGGAICYCNQEETLLWEGTEANILDVFTSEEADVDDAAAYLINKTNDCTNRIVADYLTMDTDDRFTILILTTSPIQGIKLYVDPSNPNTNVTNTNALDVEYWNGTAFTNVANLTDGTTKLTETGTLSFDSTVDNAVTKHIQERYAYAYTVSMTAAAGSSDARIYQVTVDKPMQAPTNLWDGNYRKPIQVQRYTAANESYEDFTVHVREASTVDIPVGLYLGQLAATGHVVMMFDEPMSAIKFTMLGSLVNVANAQFAAAGGIQYWDGNSWSNLTFTDETLDATADSSCSKTGLIHWNPPSDEEQQELFGTIGYAYKFIPDNVFTGAADNEVTADLITGVPAQQDVKVYKCSAPYKNKLMLCGYVEGNEGNRIDFSVDHQPHMYNGLDSSDNGSQSIYVGSVEEITAATQMYNRFGSNIFSMFVILKNNETWMMVGEDPLTYKIYPISFSLGCPAPYSLCTAEVGFKIGEEIERNVSMWISHQGPVMFDGAIIHPLPGIEKYFDPNESDSINFDYISIVQSWFDSTYNEWNSLMPTGGSTTNNKWLVYDLRKQRWFQKDVNLGEDIFCGIQCIATNGDTYIYGGSDDGRLYELETGANWNGSPITYTVTTGDFFPTKNQWDETLIRRLKLVTKRLTESGAEVKIYYQSNTDSDSGIALTWKDMTSTLSNGEYTNNFNYDNENGGPFSAGETITWDAGASSGTLVAFTDDGATGHMSIITTDTIEDNDDITGSASGASCDVNEPGYGPGGAGLSFTDVVAALTDSGDAGLSFYSPAGELLDMSIDQGLNRLIRVTKDMNEIAWAHAFKFEFTSSESSKGFEPIMWGVQTGRIRLDQ